MKTEKECDEFAVSFKEWCDECYLYNMENFTTKELLEIYKKFKNDYGK